MKTVSTDNTLSDEVKSAIIASAAAVIELVTQTEASPIYRDMAGVYQGQERKIRRLQDRLGRQRHANRLLRAEVKLLQGHYSLNTVFSNIESEKDSMIQYQLTPEGTALWHSTEGKPLDGYYRTWFTKLAIQDMSSRWQPKTEFYITDHNGVVLATLKTVKIDHGGPP